MSAASKTMLVDIAIASLEVKWKKAIVMGTTIMPPPTPATDEIPSKKGRKIVGKISDLISGNRLLC